MELKGRLIDIVKDLLTGEFRITLGVLQISSGIDALREGPISITLKKWREKRSLTANAYYWVLVTNIAAHLHESQSAVHNILLRRYGTLEIVDGSHVTLFIPDTDEAYDKALNAETYHIKPTSFTKEGKDGRRFRAYRMIKGSSEYDTLEMSRLIDGAVQEAKGMGLETMDPEEIARMMENYAKYHSDRR